MSLARVIWCFVPLALSFLFVVFLEEKINRWFAPFSGASPAAVRASPGAGPSPAPKKARRSERTRFKVALDPGHGGRGEPRRPTMGDNWDSAAGEFLGSYLNGGSRTVNKITYTEHEIVLALGKRLKLLLDKTTDDAKWPEFEAVVKRYSDLTKASVKRVWIEAKLMRESSYLDHPDAANPNVNKHFRLFDAPDAFPWTPGAPLFPGRISRINQTGADLLVALHANDSFNTSLRGSTALFVPPYPVYDLIRQASLNQRSWDDFRNTPYYTYWSYTKLPSRRREELAEDMTRYFLDGVTGGAKGTGHQRTGRADRVQWRYRQDPPVERADLAGRFEGPYWERERSIYEGYRRNAGPEEFGGDNLFAGQELTRYLRYALWQDFLKKPGPLPFPAQPVRASAPKVDPDAPPPGSAAAAATGLATSYGLPFPPDAYLGRHAPPLCSDWLVSLYTNSVAAYLEVAYLSNPADLWLLDNKLDVIAEGIAVGIYSLCAGLKTKDLPGLQSPRGIPVDWDRYLDAPTAKSYFEMARPDGAR